MARYKVGDQVVVHKRGYAQFRSFGTWKDPGKKKHFIEDPKYPRPWYPHRKIVTIVEIKDEHLTVREKLKEPVLEKILLADKQTYMFTGKKIRYKWWPNSIGWWAVTKDLDYYEKDKR